MECLRRSMDSPSKFLILTTDLESLLEQDSKLEADIWDLNKDRTKVKKQINNLIKRLEGEGQAVKV